MPGRPGIGGIGGRFPGGGGGGTRPNPPGIDDGADGLPGRARKGGGGGGTLIRLLGGAGNPALDGGATGGPCGRTGSGTVAALTPTDTGGGTTADPTAPIDTPPIGDGGGGGTTPGPTAPTGAPTTGGADAAPRCCKYCLSASLINASTELFSDTAVRSRLFHSSSLH